MAGCYGNNHFDKHFERLLDAHLDRIEDNQPFYYDNYEMHQTCSCCGINLKLQITKKTQFILSQQMNIGYIAQIAMKPHNQNLVNNRGAQPHKIKSMKTYKIIFRNSKTGLPQGTTIQADNKAHASLKVKGFQRGGGIVEGGGG